MIERGAIGLCSLRDRSAIAAVQKAGGARERARRRLRPESWRPCDRQLFCAQKQGVWASSFGLRAGADVRGRSRGAPGLAAGSAVDGFPRRRLRGAPGLAAESARFSSRLNIYVGFPAFLCSPPLKVDGANGKGLA